MKFIVPKTLDLQSSLNFCTVLDGLKNNENFIGNEEIIYDYVNLNRVEPFGMLILGSKIRELVNEFPNCAHEDRNFKNQGSASSYAAHMGFFKSVYQDYGKMPGEAKGSDTYIPIKYINIDSMRNDRYKELESISKEIAQILSRGNKNLELCLSYSTFELLRNILEHSESKSFWYSGQYWPSKKIVEVCILDEGIGITNSIKKNKKIIIDNDLDAIRLSLEPGISTNGIARESNDFYSNSGFGLYMISNICKEGGDIAICTGSKCLLINKNKESIYETSFKGTAIRIRLDLNKLGTAKEMITNLSKVGTKRARKFKKLKTITSEILTI